MKINFASICILASLILTSCAVNSTTGTVVTINQNNQDRFEEQKMFTVNLIPPEGGKSIWEGKELEPPYSKQVLPGKTYNVQVETSHGVIYDGSIKVLADGGSIGKYPGYDVRLLKYIRGIIKQEKHISFYLNSPSGRQVLLVTFISH